MGKGALTPLSNLAALAYNSNPACMADFNLQNVKTLAVDIISLNKSQLVVSGSDKRELNT